MDLEHLDRHTESGAGDESESQIDESQMDEDDSFAQAIAKNLDHEMFPHDDKDDHQENNKDQHQKELDVER